MDLKDLEAQIDSTTKALLINNPANPTGSNYSKAHLLALLELAQRHKLVIIADEIYGQRRAKTIDALRYVTLCAHFCCVHFLLCAANIVFGDSKFYALAELTTPALDVPILTCGGFAKQYLAPGWRMGWCLFHDFHHHHPKSAAAASASASAASAASASSSASSAVAVRAPVLGAVRDGALRLSQLLLGATTFLQAALPTVFQGLDTTDYYTTLNKTLQTQASFFVEHVNTCIGLTPITPQGAMYVMVCMPRHALNSWVFDRSLTSLTAARDRFRSTPKRLPTSKMTESLLRNC